jgi:hypothetical protein
VTTSHSVLLVDGSSGDAKPVHRGQGLYFGIASDGERFFVAARGRMVSSEVPAELEDGRILVFDPSLNLLEEIAAPFALRDMHEILWHEGKLWITCSFDNMVAVYEPASGHWQRWYPLGPTAAPPYDVNHFNSFGIVDGALAILAHNMGDSEVLRFDTGGRQLLSRRFLGRQAHNVRTLDDGALLTCSSGEGDLVATNGWHLKVGGFPRGLVLGEHERYVGISEIAERQDRDLTTGRIAVYDGGWNLQRTLLLPQEGLLLELAAYAP